MFTPAWMRYKNCKKFCFSLTGLLFCISSFFNYLITCETHNGKYWKYETRQFVTVTFSRELSRFSDSGPPKLKSISHQQPFYLTTNFIERETCIWKQCLLKICNINRAGRKHSRIIGKIALRTYFEAFW